MSKKEDVKSDKPKQEKQDNGSSEAMGQKKGRADVLKSKKTLTVAVVFVLVIVAVGLAAVFLMNTSSDESGDSTEQTLSPAETRELYKLEEGATQDDHNSNNLSLAWDYYRESNYDRALELLELIQDPVENIITSYNELYGLVLSATGREDEAQSYHQATLEVHEEFLLASVEEDPTAYYNLGILYTNVGQTDKAVESYEKFIAIYEAAPEEAVTYEGWDDELVELAKQALEELR